MKGIKESFNYNVRLLYRNFLWSTDGVYWENSIPEGSIIKTLLTHVPGIDLYKSNIFFMNSQRDCWDP